MKKILFLCLVIAFFIACSQQEQKFPQGAWQQYSTDSYLDGKLEERQVVNFTNIKMFSEKNWDFVMKIQTDSSTQFYCGGGTYILDGNDYTEIIDMHMATEYEGKTLKMTVELKNDTLIQTWNPLDSTGNPNTQIRYVDKYIFLK